MTFELSLEHQQVAERARALAESLRGRGAEIDRTARIPAGVADEVRTLCGADLLASAIVVETVAAASAAAALTNAADDEDGRLGLAGLRGAPSLEDTPRTQLLLAAAALGIGRRALDEALATLRDAAQAPGAEIEKPHWVVADVATELDAARLMTYKAARTGKESDIALARLLASGAATRAVDAALRVVGPAALEEGATLERLARDVRVVAAVLGGEEEQRSMAAAGVFHGEG